MVKVCLLLAGAMIGGLVIGLVVTAILSNITGDFELSSQIGSGIGLISCVLILVYAPLWYTDPEEIANPSKPTSTIQRRRAAKARSKLQTAELRIGFVFAMIGGMTASTANGSNIVITIVTICCAVLGGFVGFDFKRRVRRIRDQFRASRESDDD